MMKTVISSSTPSPCCDAWNACAVPENPVDDRRRQRCRARCLFTSVDGRAERDARREVERDRHGRQLPRVRDALRADAALERRDVGQRNLPPARRRHEEMLERRRVELRARHRLHHDPVLVGRRVDRRDLLLVVRVRQRLLDRRRRHAERQRALAVDVHAHDRRRVEQVGRDAREIGQLTQLALQRVRVLVQLVQVIAAQRELVLALGLPPADADARRVLDERLEPWNAAEAPRQLAHHLVRRRTLAQRLQLDVELPLVGRRPCRRRRST